MKKIFIIFSLVLFMVSCTKQEKTKTQYKTIKVLKNHNNHLVIGGDSLRKKRAKEIITLLKHKHRERHPYIDSLVVRFSHSSQPIMATNDRGKKVIGFKVNNVEIPFSDKILKSGDMIVGSNGSIYTINQQIKKIGCKDLICLKQAEDLEKEFLRVLGNMEFIEKKIPIISNNKNIQHASFFGTWWQKNWPWMLILLTLLLLYYFFWKNENSRTNFQQTNQPVDPRLDLLIKEQEEVNKNLSELLQKDKHLMSHEYGEMVKGACYGDGSVKVKFKDEKNKISLEIESLQKIPKNLLEKKEVLDLAKNFFHDHPDQEIKEMVNMLFEEKAVNEKLEITKDSLLNFFDDIKKSK